VSLLALFSSQSFVDDSESNVTVVPSAGGLTVTPGHAVLPLGRRASLRGGLDPAPEAQAAECVQNSHWAHYSLIAHAPVVSAAPFHSNSNKSFPFRGCLWLCACGESGLGCFLGTTTAFSTLQTTSFPA
jgi:hypothetical protein